MANIVHERTRHFCIPRSGTTTYKDIVLKSSFSALSKLIFQVHTHFAACFEMCKMHLHIARFFQFVDESINDDLFDKTLPKCC